MAVNQKRIHDEASGNETSVIVLNEISDFEHVGSPHFTGKPPSATIYEVTELHFSLVAIGQGLW